jgi:selenide,water dikinase
MRAAPNPALAVTLVSPNALAVYSGMLPGVLAGHYQLREAQIALPKLTQAARAAFVPDRVDALDLEARVARLASGRDLSFDLLSLDVGSTPDASLPGAAAHAIAVRPPVSLVASWERTMAAALAGEVHTVAVVGGGAAGVEILLAMQWRLQSLCGARAPRWTLLTDEATLLAQHTPRVGRIVERLFEARAVALHLSCPAVAIERDAVVVAGGARIAAERAFLATPASAAPFLAASGLVCDARGFVLVDASLRSTSHPFVFAAGDCATQVSVSHPRSGLNAVRQGPLLASNLVRSQRGKPLRKFAPPPRGLALIGTGDRRAILSYGALAAQGEWAWRLKEWIDRRHMQRVGAAPD